MLNRLIKSGKIVFGGRQGIKELSYVFKTASAASRKWNYGAALAALKSFPKKSSKYSIPVTSILSAGVS